MLTPKAIIALSLARDFINEHKDYLYFRRDHPAKFRRMVGIIEKIDALLDGESEPVPIPIPKPKPKPKPAPEVKAPPRPKPKPAPKPKPKPEIKLPKGGNPFIFDDEE